MELFLIVCAILAYKAYREQQKKEAFLANPERGMAELQYEQANKAATQATMINVGGGLLRLLFGK